MECGYYIPAQEKTVRKMTKTDAYDKYKARYQDGKRSLPLLRIRVDKTTK
jgi:hypothetical protein